MTDSSRYRLPLSARGLPRLCAFVIVALVALHVALRVWQFTGHEVPLDLQLVFDVDNEATVPTWYSAIAIFVCALLLAAIAGAKRRERDRATLHWYGLAIGMAAMSLDEVAAIHEDLNTFSPIDWTVPALIMVVVLAAIYVPFVLRLEKRTRLRFIVAGVVYLAGALGIEALVIDRGLFPYSMESFQYYCMTGLEEGLEMAGIVIFMRALLLYMEADQGGGALSLGIDVRE